MNYIFYHIYCNDVTLSILKDQICKIHFSGLYTIVDSIFCCVVGESKYIHECVQFIKTSGRRFKIIDIKENDDTYGRFTLLKIREYIKPEDNILYIHTKGVTKNTMPIFYWRSCMEYFLFTKYHKCLEFLETHDIVGIFYLNYIHEKMDHFSGNMWWAKGSYILQLPLTIGDNYNCPEFYIGLGNPKVKNILKQPDLNLNYDLYEFYRYCDI